MRKSHKTEKTTDPCRSVVFTISDQRRIGSTTLWRWMPNQATVTPSPQDRYRAAQGSNDHHRTKQNVSSGKAPSNRADHPMVLVVEPAEVTPLRSQARACEQPPKAALSESYCPWGHPHKWQFVSSRFFTLPIVPQTFFCYNKEKMYLMDV